MDLQIIGLIYDAAGIVVLGVPALFRAVSEIDDQSATKWNFNRQLAIGLSKSRIDATAGSFLLVVGFAIQVASLSGCVATPHSSDAVLTILVLFLLAYWAHFRGYFVGLILNGIDRKHEKGKV